MINPNLTELISSRICHDLISPVGAVYNGVELIVELQGTSPEIDMIGQSAKAAQAKLEFFRIAFGASDNSLIGQNQVTRIATEMFAGGRISIDFPKQWGERPRKLVKLLYLLLLCIETSLPRGGILRCTPTLSGWEIDTNGTPVNPDMSNWDHLLSGQNLTETTAKNVQFSLARSCALDTNTQIKLFHTKDSLKTGF